MAITIHCARITGHLSYMTESGMQRCIPIGPCLVELVDGRSIDIIWGAHAQSRAALATEEVAAAQLCGSLIVVAWRQVIADCIPD